jgi:hypothetical protein
MKTISADNRKYRDQRSFAALEARVRELERLDRRARRVTGAALVFAAVVALAAASPALSISNVPDVLAARRFHIVDDSGAVVGRWVSTPGGSMRLETLAGEEVTGVVEVAAKASTRRTAAPTSPPPAAAAPEAAPAVQAPDASDSVEKAAPAAEGDKNKEREPFDWLD